MLATLLASAALAAAPFPETIPVPAGLQPEGIASGKGTTFYVGSRANGLGLHAATCAPATGAILVPGAGRARGVRAQGARRQAVRRRRADRARSTSTTRAPARTSTPSSCSTFDGAASSTTSRSRATAAYFTDSD